MAGSSTELTSDHGFRIEWETPPAITGLGVHEALFDELRRNPGRWAVFRRDIKNPGGLLEKLRKGRYKGITIDELEVRSTRDPATRLSTIYIRVPENKEEVSGEADQACG